MLKLKYLFDNRDLAIMLLENWEYDKDALDMLDYYRISGNAIYPYKCNGEICFLRFVPWEANIENELNEEIKFIQYLLENGLNVLEPIMSKQRNYLLSKNTPWGKYLVCAFKRVEGDRLDGFNSNGIDWTDELISGYGKELGKIHKFSSKYKNVFKKSCFEMIEEMDNFIKTKLENDKIISKELEEVKSLLQRLPQDKSNYGLIHGDYELDNVFYDKKTKKYSVIDFGSSIYHWYTMDIEISLNNLQEELPQKKFEEIKTLFINGYKKEYQINGDEFKYLTLFKRFENLRKYIELIDLLEETWDNEPLWMLELRENLNNSLKEFESNFANNYV